MTASNNEITKVDNSKDGLMADLENIRAHLGQLLDNPEPELESWYMALETVSNVAGRFQYRIKARRKNLFYN